MFEPNVESAAASAALEKLRIGAEEQARIRRFAERFRIYADDYADVIHAAVRRAFTDPRKVERIVTLGDSTMNPLRQVVDETYAYPGARRRFVAGDAEDPVFGEAFELAGGPLVMAEASIAAGGFNDGLIMCLPAKEDEAGNPMGSPKLRLFLPHEVTVVEDEDDPGKPAEVRYIVRRPNGDEEVVCWTAAEHWIEVQEGRSTIRKPARGASSTENPYQRLPFIAVHGGLRPDCFWDCQTGQRLAEFAIQYGRDWAAFNYLQFVQGYLQILVTGVGKDWKGWDYTGPGAILTAEGNVKVDVLNLQAQLDPVLNKLKLQLTMALRSYGVDAERYLQNPGQAPMSGIARMIERMDLLERRKKLRPFLLRAERELGELFRWAWNWNHDDKIAEAAEYQVEILEEEVLLSPLERIDFRTKQLQVFKLENELGFGDQVEQFAEYRGLPLEKAREILAARKAAAPPAAPPPAPPAQE